MAQPDFISLIKEKTARLDSVPTKFLSQVKKSEREIYERVIELLGQLESKNGLFLPTAENLKIANEINDQLKLVLLNSEFSDAVSRFASEFDLQADLNFQYFNKAFGIKKTTEFGEAIVLASKRNAIDLLLNTGADSDFVSPLANIIEQSVVNNASYGDTLKAVREFIEGTNEIDSRLLRYSTQISRDAFAVADASYVSAYSDELDVEWFYYSGGIIDTSRAFCKEREDQFFYYKEIEEWGRGHKTTGFSLPDSDGRWQGQILGTTDATIWSYRGGYNCGHSFMPVSIFGVPLEVIQRNINQGFFKPTEKEAELLGL